MVLHFPDESMSQVECEILSSKVNYELSTVQLFNSCTSRQDVC